MTIYRIDRSGGTVYEAGAALIATLAYPDARDEAKRANLMASLCSEVLRLTTETDLDWATTPQPIKPAYVFRDQALIRRDLRTLGRRLRDRMVAARMVMPFLQQAFTGRTPALPPQVKRLSIGQMAALVLDDLDQDDAKNIEARVWRPSKPVLHIGAAFAVAIDQRERIGIQRTDIGDVLTDPDLLDWILAAAEEYEALLLSVPRLGLVRDEMVQLRRS